MWLIMFYARSTTYSLRCSSLFLLWTLVFCSPRFLNLNPGRFITGRFIPDREKQLAVGPVLTAFVRRSHTTLVWRPNLCICAMDVSNDRQHVNTVRDFEVGVTKRGKPTVIHDGFEYWRHRQNSVGQVTWRCCQFQAMKCPATIKTAGNHVISLTAQHTHEDNVATSRARAAVHQMKQKITENAVTPRVAQASVVAQLSNEVKMALPDKNVVARSLRRYREACNKTAPTVLPPRICDGRNRSYYQHLRRMA